MVPVEGSLSKNMKRRWPLILGGLIVCGVGLNALRVHAHGVKNMVNPAYWEAEFTGTNLYQPDGAILKRGNPNLPEIAITFDDGPHPQSLPLILATLKREGIHATFFLVGKRIKEHPELAAEIVNEGHEVGNHTQDHLRLTDLPLHQAKAKLDNCEINFQRATKHKFSLMRPPGMRFSKEITEMTQSMGYTTVSWTNAAKDFDSVSNKIEGVTKEEIARRAMQNIENGSIMLLHDTPQTAEALPLIIDELKASGYKFVTIPEMLSHLPNPIIVRTNLNRDSSVATRPR